jgi:hypothetical protein
MENKKLHVFEDPFKELSLGFKGVELATNSAVWEEINKLVDNLLDNPGTDRVEAKEYLKYLIDSLDCVGGCFYCPNITET